MRSGNKPSRRAFLEKLLSATVVAAACPAVVLTAIKPRLRMRGASMLGDYQVKISDYPELATIGGSVRLAVANLGGHVILTRIGAGAFAAVSSLCAHEGNDIDSPYSVATGVIRCTRHGSEYDATGKVTKGPAIRNLLGFPARFDGADTVTITVPVAAVFRENPAVVSVRVSMSDADTLRVRFTTDRAAHVLIGVYDRVGDQVLVVLDEDRAAGWQCVDAEAVSLPDGSYFCRMQTSSGFAHTTSFVIIR